MPKYQKKQIVVDAIQWTGGNWSDVWDFINDEKGDMRTYSQQLDKTIKIRTLEGDMIANVNDWIIRGVEGEIYPCKPRIFDKTYEPVEE